MGSFHSIHTYTPVTRPIPATVAVTISVGYSRPARATPTSARLISTTPTDTCACDQPSRTARWKANSRWGDCPIESQQDPADQRDGRIVDEHQQNRAPGEHRDSGEVLGRHGEGADHEAEHGAAGVAEEDLGRRPVPPEEAGAGAGNHERDGRQPGKAGGVETEQGPGDEAEADRFDRDNSVDTVHEVEEIRAPRDAHRSQCKAEHAKVGLAATEVQHGVPVDPHQGPDRREEVGAEPYADRETAEIIDPAGRGDDQRSSRETDGEVRLEELAAP